MDSFDTLCDLFTILGAFWAFCLGFLFKSLGFFAEVFFFSVSFFFFSKDYWVFCSGLLD